LSPQFLRPLFSPIAFCDFVRVPYRAIYEFWEALPTPSRCPRGRRGAAQNPRTFKKALSPLANLSDLSVGLERHHDRNRRSGLIVLTDLDDKNYLSGCDHLAAASLSRRPFPAPAFRPRGGGLFG